MQDLTHFNGNLTILQRLDVQSISKLRISSPSFSFLYKSIALSVIEGKLQKTLSYIES